MKNSSLKIKLSLKSIALFVAAVFTVFALLQSPLLAENAFAAGGAGGGGGGAGGGGTGGGFKGGSGGDFGFGIDMGGGIYVPVSTTTDETTGSDPDSDSDSTSDTLICGGGGGGGGAAGDGSDGSASNPNSCTIGSPVSILMAANDPNSEDVRYLVDWDADGSVNVSVPESGYVSSGTSKLASRTFTTEGAHTVRFRAENTSGALSDWSEPIVFNCIDTRFPNAPIVNAPSGDQCIPGEEQTITLTATHPAGKDMYYQVDIDRDGTADIRTPATETLASGTTQSFQYTFERGTYGFNVRAVDIDGLSSVWSTVAGTCGVSQDTCPTCQTGTPSISIGAQPSLVVTGQTSQIIWSITGLDTVQSCTISATNGDSASWETISATSDFTTSPITQMTTYTLSCIFDDIGTITDSMTVHLVPQWQEF
ncbi:hypothetical protein COB18_02665 [Candidatus Kaiserbacteria bacterium]|nr:MAG: hypothetical protein COB18_02665 [Candidatus Kaiserbacteria bacterium]